jgi:uncharacterized protein YoaH (UPF0181 family)
MTTTNATEQESIIRKIQKLLALGQSSNEAEANLAMARAQELLAKHNLEMAMIKDAVVAGGTVQAEEKRENTRISRSAQYKWQQMLWEAICKANFCWYSVAEVFEGKRGTKATTSKVRVKRHMVLGSESNVMAVRIMGEYLEDTMERILPFPNNERLSRSAISWKTGCAERLAQRVVELAEQRKRESDAARSTSSGTAIVLRDVYQREYQANYDARYGKGAYARSLARNAEWEAGRAEREVKAKAEREQAEKEWLEYLQNETPAQKKTRERQEAKEAQREEAARRRRNRSWHNEQRRNAQRTDWDAYQAGREQGNEIGLDSQLAASQPRKEIK